VDADGSATPPPVNPADDLDTEAGRLAQVGRAYATADEVRGLRGEP
jgi:hypothetical protein